MDRRILKTQKAIIKSMTELLLEKDFKEITINEVAEKADVSRGTIYLHYKDKVDILKKCMSFYLEKIFENSRNEGESNILLSKESMFKTFEYLEKHILIYRALLKSGSDIFKEDMKVVVLKEVKGLFANNGTEDQVTLQFLSHSIIGVTEWWIKNGMPIKPNNVSSKLWELTNRVKSI